MKTNTIKYTFSAILFVFLVACSTKKDKFLNRNFQALNTKNNVLYNGDIALQTGIKDLKSGYNDNFWETLPIERMQVSEEDMMPGDSRDPNFEKSEDKAIKAIQKRSMLIGGRERNPQIDEAHLLLGKSRYYDQRFIPALEAFNYILYKYPNSDKIYEAKIWREKTNIRLENDALAINNLNKLLNEIEFKDQIFADAHASLAQAYLNTDDNSKAIKSLKLATEFTKHTEERARYQFILGQLYDTQKLKDSSFAMYQNVIDMKRKSPRRYVIQAHINQAKQFDYKNGDTLAYLEKFKKLIEDRENRPFLDALHHQKALFYDALDKKNDAVSNYNLSLKNRTQDNYLTASNYRNIAEIYFYKAKYQESGKYYDSTLVMLQPRTREFNAIKKKRENLDDVIKYEGIAQKNDSILNILALSESDRISFYEEYIAKIKKEDELKAKKEKEEAKLQERLAVQDEVIAQGSSQSIGAKMQPPGGTSSQFYFYNPASVAQGKLEFVKRWGKRNQNGYWRSSTAQSKNTPIVAEDFDKETNDLAVSDSKDEKENPRYLASFYINQLPKTIKERDSLATERNFAYYQLGIIYKEKFKEYELAANRLEMVLKSKPDERLVLPSMYNLYKIYEIIDKNKAAQMKDKIINQFPDSRYAQILTNSTIGSQTLADDPDVAYAQLFKIYENGDYRAVYFKMDEAIEKFTGEEIIPKLELLKATTNGKLKGLNEYKNGLNYVALNYPNKQEGKESEEFLRLKMPQLENLDFNQDAPSSWKIIFEADDLESKKTKTLPETVAKFIKDRGETKLTSSVDIYTLEQNFLVIHGIRNEEAAVSIVSILKEFKDYKVTEPAIIISNENYKVVQIKKSLKDYLNPNYIPLEKKVFAQPLPKQDVPKPPVPATIKPIQKQNANPGKQPAGKEVPRDVLKSSELLPPTGGTKKG
ncbi:type IX secretion system periplasmic lipoprotein PorW/SprE [Flavobacterium orientale]|uniref:Gliding motility protein n=1 Tax=Flavobacterium orientale TaxID=1756020 RepID=A0A916XZZ9_9FLAO|nr:gliding motility protein [Flavobacterium orientale]GGD22882.1 gliding motility protein [Flavobacterium orientale]